MSYAEANSDDLFEDKLAFYQYNIYVPSQIIASKETTDVGDFGGQFANVRSSIYPSAKAQISLMLHLS